jgi:phosphatidylglycerol:prolipoprotein diacylglycerol transferase
LFGFYFLLAGIERFLIEFLRAKDDHIVGPFTTAQYIAIASALAGAALMYARRNVTSADQGIYAHPAGVAATA